MARTPSKKRRNARRKRLGLRVRKDKRSSGGNAQKKVQA